ncbi:MAG: hypothetical protein ACJ8LL_06655 [Candidatus Udaeobacter sp.]
MSKFLPLLLCLLLSIFTLGRATKSTHMTVSPKTSHNEPSGQEAVGKILFDDANADEHDDDNDSTEAPSNADGENTNDDGNDDALGDQTAGDDDTGDDDGSDDGGGGEAQ